MAEKGGLKFECQIRIEVEMKLEDDHNGCRCRGAPNRGQQACLFQGAHGNEQDGD